MPERAVGGGLIRRPAPYLGGRKAHTPSIRITTAHICTPEMVLDNLVEVVRATGRLGTDLLK